MAHLINSMAYTNAPPWHGLGNRLTEKQPIEVWAQQAGMDWKIRQSPVYFHSQEKTSVLYPDHQVLFRSDTEQALSVVSSRYQVVQPREILEFYRDLTEAGGFELETAGVLKGGRKVWALAKTNQSAAIKRNDVVNGYLLLATACDGTLATTAQFTSVRVVCNNTLAVALTNGTGAIKVPHSTVFNAEAVKKQLDISVSSWDRFIYRMKTLSERKVTHQEAENFVRRLFNEIASSPNTVNGRAMKKVMELYNGGGRGAELSSAKGTVFGLLNAVTEFVDHERRARSQDYRLDSAWFGAGAVLKQKSLGQAMLLVQ
jgi:phage/plasmid-like protein (TIGR03299 family)